MSIDCCFIACSCSKTPSSVDWNCDIGWIIYGSSRNVALISPETNEMASIITGTYCEHDGDVTCVKWIKTSERNPREIFAISGGTDSRAILWRFDPIRGQLHKTGVCIGHELTITHVSGLKIDDKSILCTCSADSTIRIWNWNTAKEDETIKESQKIEIEKSGFALCGDMHSIGNGILLATGHDDKKIHLHWKSEYQKPFVRVMTLAGHGDWIRGLHFQPNGPFDGSLLLASCAQDSYARVWRITGLPGDSGKLTNGSVEGGIQLKRQMFTIEISNGNLNCAVTLDAVLTGHEDWIYSIQWHPEGSSKLLTASMDKCLIIWEPDETSGIWIEKSRLGVVGGPVASGFYGGLFGPKGSAVLGHTFQGGLHVWRESEGEWQPAVVPGGHFGPVEDLRWDPNGFYLLSCSADQTTRLYAPWIRNGKTPTIHEIARPQVHGYDMQCIASVSSSCFVSAAEEKILRSFTSTKTFAENFQRISSSPVEVLSLLEGSAGTIADGACVPSLGLSNKAVFIGDMEKETSSKAKADGRDAEPLVAFQAAELHSPPTEDCLMQNTLWPEVHKLYGHGCEIFSVACNHSGTLIASAAKASKPDQAQIILWSTSDWQQRSQLAGHSLTVTQIAFSPDDAYLLTVSRDRTWCLYRKNTDDFDWIRVGYTDKKTAVHGRIIWSCAWTPDSKYYVTTSRDKKVVVWALSEENTGTSTGMVRQIGQILEVSNSATAVAICPQVLHNGSYLVAVGLESGEILFYEWNKEKQSFTEFHYLDKSMAHSLTVKRLQFRPLVQDDSLKNLWTGSNDGDRVLIASCSEDHSVKIYRIHLKSLLS